MKLIIDKNRKVYSAGTWGTKNENNYEILDFEFPDELEEYNKRIVYYLGNEKVWDAIIDNKAILTNAITTKGSVKAYIWCTKSDAQYETDVDFRTQLFEMNFFENENADGIVPTEEQIDGFNTMLTAMNEKIEEIDELETTIKNAETQRQENEETRQNNEKTRQENEQTRQNQEAERERRTDKAIADIKDKTAEYNTNAEAKTTAFNTNASDKTTAFDNNASSKTSDFNTNAESKTNTFNDNATQKTTDFNNNAQAKTDAFDEHTAEITADIEELQQEVEELSENMPWSTTEQATEINVDDAAKYSRNKLEIFGNTEQASYDGKNILKSEYFYPSSANGYNSIIKLVEEGDNYLTFTARPGNQSSYNIIFPCKPNTNYVYKCEKIILYNANDEILSESGGWHSGNSKAFSSYTLQDTTSATMGYTKYVSSRSGALSGTNVSGKYVKFTTAEEETECCISFQGDKANKIKIINPMLYEGTDTDIDYEPYVGGVPSPNPDYPQGIHVVTGNNTISIQGKNLIDYSALNKYNRDLSGAPSVGSPLRYYNNSKALQFNVSVSNFVGKNIFFSFDFSHTNFRRFALDTNGNYIETFSNGGLIKENYSYITILINSNVDIPTSTNIKFMAEQGSIATSYVPYYHADYPINLGSIELCKIEDYQDYLYKENGNWYKYEVINKKQLTSNMNWVMYEGDTNLFGVYGFSAQNSSKVLCTHYQGITYPNSVYNINNNEICYQNIKRLWIRDTRFSTLEEFKEWLDENVIELLFVLSTATKTQITDETLISQLDAIYEHLQLVKGTNNITVTAEDLAPYMKLTYMQDLKSKLDNLDSRLSLLE